jgi:hypothetical protein
MGKSSLEDKSLKFKGPTMYKVTIDISDWGSDEFVTIETTDFEKVQIIQEFITFQQENGWSADYEAVVDFEEEDEEEDEEPSTVSTYVITKIEE